MFCKSICGWRLDVVLSRLFFFNDTATTEIYTLSLHDALPIWQKHRLHARRFQRRDAVRFRLLEMISGDRTELDRKSTRLNSSHANISYAVFCLKKKTPHVLMHIPNPHAC